MNPSTQELIKKHIQKIIKDFDFEKRKTEHSEDCICYAKGKCHNLKELNCFLCYCPEYDNSKTEGGCKIKSKKGEWLFSEKLPEGKIWDCTNCDYPHRKEVVERYLRGMFEMNQTKI